MVERGRPTCCSWPSSSGRRPSSTSRRLLERCDAVMVARGDLGLEMPLEGVPRVQKQVILRARTHGLPVIVATQVLESMRSEPMPTRAEVSDAANAVDDGVDAIMLAGETAAGAYPVQAVQTLARIIARRRAAAADGGRGRRHEPDAREPRAGDVRRGADAGQPRERGRHRRDHLRGQHGADARVAAPVGADRGRHRQRGRGPAARALSRREAARAGPRPRQHDRHAPRGGGAPLDGGSPTAARTWCSSA